MIIHVFSGKWPEPQGVQIRMEQGRMIPVSEAERREVFLQAVGNEHPLMGLILKCINNDFERRPRAHEILPQLTDMVAQNPPSYSNRLEMLQEIEAQKALLEEKTEELRQRLEPAPQVKQGI